MTDQPLDTQDVATIEEPAEIVPYQRPPVLPSADEFGFVMQMADALAKSQLVPTSARGKPADVAIILLAARDMGIPVTQALAKLHVIEGKLSLSAEMMVALALRDGHRIWCEELTLEQATACAQRRGSDYVARFTFTREDADRAQLLGKDNWKKYPKAMLWARAVSGIVRMELPDVTAGVTYTPEEIGDEERFSAHPATVADPDIREALAARIAALPDDRKAELKQAWQSWGLNPLSRLTVEEEKPATELVAKAEAIDAREVSQEGAGAAGSVEGSDGPPAAPEAETGVQGSADTGHCATCGGPIWYSAKINAWIHADESDDRLHPDKEPFPAIGTVDVDALYAASHPPTATCAGCGKTIDPTTTGEGMHVVRGGVTLCDRCEKDGFDPAPAADARRARIEAEVLALSQTKLLKAIVDAKLEPEGGPKAMRERLVAHRLAAVADSA